MRILVTGATGYIGGRLVPRLLEQGHTVRCLVRTPSKLRDVPWAKHIEIVQGDVTDPESVQNAAQGIDVLYYLVHSLGTKGFDDLDRRAAETVADAAAHQNVQRIVYLGGLTPEGVSARDLSPHLRSRTEVGQIFLDSSVPTVVLNAAVIIGSGSASFEMLRYLTERLPAMVTPRWVRNRIQPIAVRDVLRYLVESAEIDSTVNRAFDIGGPDVLTYRDMMQRYARVAGLPRRFIVPVGVLSPTLSAQWVNVVTPVPRAIAIPLVQSLIHEVVCHEHDIAEYVPDLPEGLTPYDHAVELALRRIRDDAVETTWSWASTPGAPSDPLPSDPEWSGGSAYVDVRERVTKAHPQTLWRVIEGIGGENGWYSFPLAWSVRGWMDRVIGGAGLRRGRRDRDQIYVGEALDWWRVEEIEPGHLLRLRAEMRVPGRAWLELTVAPDPVGARYRQRAVFLPRGLAGHAYWIAIVPFHGIVFGGMVRNITRAAERAETGEPMVTATGLPLQSPIR
ncbi:SDR family oxidoreductase [Cryptosporangium phraense]|uniref:SDR family oxidoreductase n=1 Tax=Cryptosporangium phraense TaxID=2593070 RepID=A0A545AI47_9ACTN|nr:SDR family oxidoreductase [Cryptosporangium phraense]TQS40994.1 SDR family oxidoreductase [Cryptosporangium phraense]